MIPSTDPALDALVEAAATLREHFDPTEGYVRVHVRGLWTEGELPDAAIEALQALYDAIDELTNS